MAAVEAIPERLRDPKTEADRRERDRMLYQLRAGSGLTWPRLAHMFGLSERHCSRVVSEYRERCAVDQLDEQVAQDVLRDSLEGFDDTIERLTIIASGRASDAVKVGALRTRLHTYEARIELLARLGVIDVAQVRVRVDLEQSASRLLDVFERFGVAEEVRKAAIDALDVTDAEVVELTAGDAT